jgi:hypothetical protein
MIRNYKIYRHFRQVVKIFYIVIILSSTVTIIFLHATEQRSYNRHNTTYKFDNGQQIILHQKRHFSQENVIIGKNVSEQYRVFTKKRAIEAVFVYSAYYLESEQLIRLVFIRKCSQNAQIKVYEIS